MSTKVEPTWRTPEEKPAFLNRTQTQYWRGPINSLKDRGIENRLLESLVYALPPGVIIAGGFMTAVMGENTDAQDVDLFFTNERAFIETYELLTSNEDSDDEAWAIKGYSLDPKAKEVVAGAMKFKTNEQENESAELTLKNIRYLKFVHPKRLPIQLIKLAWYTDAEHVIDSFDLTVAQFAVQITNSGEAELVANPISFIDLARKRLVLHRMQFPSSTLRRVIKYSKKGYYACPGSLATIAQSIASNIQNDDQQFVYID